MVKLDTLWRSSRGRSARGGKARGTASQRAFAEKLGQVLVQGLGQAGIPAKVEFEPIPATRLVRVLLTARKFRNLRPSERQDLVWRIVASHFKPDEQLKISMINTLTPEELAGDW